MPTRTGARARTTYFPRLAAERPDIALCRASTAVARAAEAAAEQHGLGVGHHLVLKMLAAVGPCSQQVLSEELRIDRSVMVGIADELEKAGYVRRERDAQDRRAYAVTITTPGRRALTRAEKGVPAFLDQTFAALDPAERDQLTALLGKLLATDSTATD
ncbi:MarR family winged helix-turn-helix transcriptional regulator [Goodfellowiella coeruleoviolacea]|uniref:DNA-binding transcriptional regulator, MarR family n=1 Tax=Goodfellowiella coeruleoviolacea TaxID=334858 RepID=A0AAE3KK09_9PSEU|nr:MarR family winged helix-turn-helix transcriptional regulator [Goodfellowiella coeruleoviolacea]MCP2164933.1 DNA-binding transcriptional regulator, MarR family [Goodfellowiella coeruleoviolacea]